MKVHLAWITPKPGRSKEPALASLVNEYLSRTRSYADTAVLEVGSESQLFTNLDRISGRTKPMLILLDSHGKLRSSEEIAEVVRKARDNSVQHLVFAIGGPDGWSKDALGRADETLSLGRITLPHELARAVIAEQVYRAFTILAGHPYHSGH